MFLYHHTRGLFSQKSRKTILFQCVQFRKLDCFLNFYKNFRGTSSTIHNHPDSVFSAGRISFRYKKMRSPISAAQIPQGLNLCQLRSAFLSTSTHDIQMKDPTKRKNMMSYARSKNRLENETVFLDMLAEKRDSPWAAEDWDRTAEILSKSVSGPWEVMCMQTLCKEKNVSVGKSLMKYLEAQNGPPHLFATTFFIQLLGETAQSEAQEEETKKYYDLLRSRTDVLDAASIEVIVSGLSNTKYYRECLKLMEIYREYSKPGPLVLSNILNAGLRNHDSDLYDFAFCEFELTVEPTQFTIYFGQAVETCFASENHQGLDLVMNFVQKHSLLPPRRMTDEIIGIFQRYQPNRWTAKYGYIHYKGGNCVVCRHQMERIEISNEDFEAIQKAFLDQVIVSSNIFFKSTPEELENFVAFVDRTGPFDVVIDGLNVLHIGGKPLQNRLEKSIEYFMAQKKRVLVLGSKMLIRYLSKINKMKPKPAIYMTSTTKADDVFFLYAALRSGKDTLIVSHDKLRDHKFLLDPKIRHIFHQWLWTVQIYDWFFSRNGDFCVRRRHLFDIGPAKDENGWHIPVNDIDEENAFGQFTVLCLRDKAKQSETNHSSFDIEPPYEKKEKRKPKKIGRGLGSGSHKQAKQDKEWFES